MAEIVDLRGRHAVPAAPPVLADPSGRRARMLAHAGRIVAVVFLVWLSGLALAGLGILPAGDVPLGLVISPGSPSRLTHQPAPRQSMGADLAPAGPAATSKRAIRPPASTAATGSRLAVTRSSVTARRPVSMATGQGHVQATAPNRPKAATPSGTSRGGGTAGKTVTPTAGSMTPPAGSATASKAPGQSIKPATPGHTKTSTPGHSAAAPGAVRQTTITNTTPTSTSSPGKSGVAPGQTASYGSGHGNLN